MRNPLFSIKNILRFLSVFLVTLSLTNGAWAQCGLSSFNEAGGPYTPTTAWNTVTTGSGTYVDFNVTAGNIYSFYYSTPTASGTGYDWDMTLSATSGVINYNNSVTPIANSWTGGIGCPNTTQPSSAEWYSTYTGTVRVNVKSWNGGCLDYVAGQGSTVINYKVCTPSADPGSGNNVWNVDVFATTDLSIPVPNARYGYYVDNSGLDFVSTNYWAAGSNPGTAPGWSGCTMPNDNFLFRARRTGFPCGRYIINVNAADDNMVIYLNGSQIFAGSNIGSTTATSDPNGYILGPSDNLEIRTVDVCGAGVANVSVTPTGYGSVDGGAIGGIADGSNVCEGTALGQFTNVTSASGGTFAYTNGGTVTYDWQLSTDGGTTFNSVGVTTDSWNSPTTVPAGGVYVVRRAVTDKCGNTAYSNTITVTGQPTPNGSFSPTSQTICPGGSAFLTVNLSPGTGPFNITYTDGVSNFSANGLNNGDIITVTPPGQNTYTYTYLGIQDAYGCTRTSGFNGGAQVVVAQTIAVSNVVAQDVSCFGSTNGTITITAQGGQPPYQYSIDNGNTFVANSGIFTGLPPGTYVVQVQDALGCTGSWPNPVVVGEPTDVTQTLSKTDASCNGVYDGTITVTPSGGVPGYTYALNHGPTQFSSTFTGLGANDYLVSVYDSHGCEDTMSITVGSTYVISVDLDSFTDISCYGAGNGAFTVHVTGGVPSYTYSINGITFQPSGTFTGLVAATYQVVGRDSRGCTASNAVTISQPSQILVTVDSITNVLCASTPTGAIYVTTSGGTPGYTFLWNNSATTEDLTGVSGGTYNLTVTDSHGCTATNGATITQPSLLSLNIASAINPLCNGDSTGSIDVTANGGVPPYTYAWDNGSSVEDHVNLPAGSYAVTVTDANGCNQNIAQTLTDPSAITSSTSSTDVACHGGGDGTATVNFSGGTAPYLIEWSDFQATPTAINLNGGLYYVVITDHNGCQHRDSATVNEPTALAISSVVTNVTCFGANDGGVALTVTGGTPTYSYAWSTGDTGPSISGQAGGVVTVTVTDSHNCSISASYTITSPDPLVAIFTVRNVVCAGDNNGSINLTMNGGNPTYTYAWSNAFNGEDPTGLGPGTFVVTVTDTKGCTLVDSALVTSPLPLTTSGIITSVSCHGLCNGEVFTTPYGGTVPYQFAWSNGPTTENIVQLCGGQYFLTVTDANACSVVSLYIVTEPPVLTSSVQSTNPSCFGSCNGTAAVVPGGGTKPYSYLWNSFYADSALSGLCAGRYVVMLSDSNGCVKYDSATLTQPDQIVITDSVSNVLCNGASTGQICATVTGGNPTYSYSWTGGSTNVCATNLTAGTYGLTVTDATNCIQTAMATVTEPPALHTTASLNQPRCADGNDGFVQVDVVGGVIPYTYSWNTNPPQVGATATNLKAGNYVLTVTDGNQCSATVSAPLSSPEPIVVQVDSAQSRCYNTGSAQVVAHVTGGLPGVNGYNYQVNGVLQADSVFSNLFPGNYYINVTDVNGCSGNSTFVVYPGDVVTVSLTAPNDVILTGMKTQLVATATAGGSIVSYEWSPITLDSVDIFDYSACSDTVACATPYVSPPYTTAFLVKVTDSYGCFAYDTVTVIVKNQPSSFIPTAFSPNDDGLNDRFEFDILGADKIEITIWNRWGDKVYYNANQPNGFTNVDGWDGKKGSTLMPYDTYVYQMKVTYFDGVVKDLTGTVNLMR